MSSGKQKTLSRVYEINNFLLHNVKTIFRLRKIGLSHSQDKHIYAYAVTLLKDHVHTLEEMAEVFYNSCKSVLDCSEILTTEGKTFKIVSDEFEIFYYLEAWRKSADKIAYIENGIVKTELLHRMSCEQAAYVFKKYNVDLFEILNKSEILQRYDSYADKYVALAKCPYLLSAAPPKYK